jgi:hypothetical protein
VRIFKVQLKRLCLLLGRIGDQGVVEIAEALDAKLKGGPITAVRLVDGLRDIARSANPLVLNRFIDDWFRLTLGEKVSCSKGARSTGPPFACGTICTLWSVARLPGGAWP